MDNIEIMLYNAITLLCEHNKESYNGTSDPDFIDYICNELGMSEQTYKTIMQVEDNE